MLTVHKYQFALTDLDHRSAILLDVPRGAELLGAGCQNANDPGLISVWARVETDQPKIQREIVVIGTGHLAPALADDGTQIIGQHVASIVTLDGRLVWHVFDGGEVR